MVCLPEVKMPKNCHECDAVGISDIVGLKCPCETNETLYNSDGRPEKCPLKELTEWISVKDKLPDDASDVLAYYDCIDEGRVMLVNYYKRCWYDTFDNLIDDLDQGCITHWMPLPDPPKEAKQDET